MTEEKSENKNGSVPSVVDFTADAGAGLENVTQEDLIIPRLKLVQALSPQVQKHDGAYIEGISVGDIFNTVTNEFWSGEKGLTVVPVSYKRVFLEWGPERGGGLIATYEDPAILQQCTKNERYQDILPNGNQIQTTANHYVMQLTKIGYSPVMIAMTGTQLKKSKRWNSMMASLKIKGADGGLFTPATFSHKYKLTAVPESNDSGSWFGWNVTNLGMLEDKEVDIYNSAKEFGSTVNALTYAPQEVVA
ncbi:MAG: hypothetical protein CME31_00070 [Gimesia sp.]|nr:hypothetical protein [Gimesia sp.]